MKVNSWISSSNCLLKSSTFDMEFLCYVVLFFAFFFTLLEMFFTPKKAKITINISDNLNHQSCIAAVSCDQGAPFSLFCQSIFYLGFLLLFSLSFFLYIQCHNLMKSVVGGFPHSLCTVRPTNLSNMIIYSHEDPTTMVSY